MIDFKKIGEAARRSIEEGLHLGAPLAGDIDHNAGRAAVAAMIPEFDGHGQCDRTCPFCWHLDDEPHCRLHFMESPRMPGPSCPASKEDGHA